MNKWLKTFVAEPRNMIQYLLERVGVKTADDETVIQVVYFAKWGKTLDLKNPKTYVEKVNYLKLHDRNPLYHKMVDKYEVKKLVSDLIGDEYVIKLLGVWDSFEDIDFSKLPSQYVLKCTHDSGGCL